MLLVALALACVAFTVSASAGLGGSLVMVPAMTLLYGTKEGVALAALLLAGNNVFKVLAYRHTIPWRAAGWVVLATAVGSFAGARLLVAAPESAVAIAVVLMIVGTFVVERQRRLEVSPASATTLALGAGATSGFSGTSGPLKGVALRALRLDRHHLVGAASVVSLVGDATKAAVFADASLLGGRATTVLVVALPLMPLATLVGRHVNRRLGERAYAGLFWGVMAGYTLRLAGAVV